MKTIKVIAILGVAVSLSACETAFTEGAGAMLGSKADKTVDRGFDSKHLSALQAGIWIDPIGCDHWIIDDGVEGYLSPRVDKYGKPVCSGVAEPNTAVGNFKGGSTFGDPI
ncbi:hypothetical protein EDD53_1782 [Pacificibacter maritimus]|uniref:Lipoprotein n=1 Tax=Pacificibacter maritimus TaxID=762213 RepID=A0A3N4UFZ1_9RHOB|nr:hypothetical protein [Pacificibacter maritimus]RPE67375.1 hypothetical protein EDD53_1782 [Pacificibacter maritimus]